MLCYEVMYVMCARYVSLRVRVRLHANMYVRIYADMYACVLCFLVRLMPFLYPMVLMFPMYLLSSMYGHVRYVQYVMARYGIIPC